MCDGKCDSGMRCIYDLTLYFPWHFVYHLLPMFTLPPNSYCDIRRQSCILWQQFTGRFSDCVRTVTDRSWRDVWLSQADYSNAENLSLACCYPVIDLML